MILKKEGNTMDINVKALEASSALYIHVGDIAETAHAVLKRKDAPPEIVKKFTDAVTRLEELINDIKPAIN